MSTVPCKVVSFGMESCKFQPACFSHFLVISKHKGKHQIVRNQKLQLLGAGLRVQNSDRYRNMVVRCSIGSGIPTPSDPTPGSNWKLWILGTLMSIIIPFWRGKWGPLLKLKEEVETVIDTVEAVTDVVEKVAEQVEKVADEIGDHLPEGRLKDAFEFVEDIAENTSDNAHLAGGLIDKVEDMVDDVEEKVESLVKPVSHEEAKETAEEAKSHA